MQSGNDPADRRFPRRLAPGVRCGRRGKRGGGGGGGERGAASARGDPGAVPPAGGLRIAGVAPT